MDQEFVLRLRELIKEHAEEVYTRFAKIVGVSATTMQRYIEGRAAPGYDIIRRICTTCGVTPNWLLFGWEPRYGAENQLAGAVIRIVDQAGAETLNAADYITVPILNQNAWVEHGRGITLVGPNSTDGFTVVPAGLGQRVIAVPVCDASMAPEIEESDLALVDMEDRDMLLLENRLVLAQTEDGVAPRRLMKGILFSNNPRHFPPERCNRQKLLGLIIQVRRTAPGTGSLADRKEGMA
jgi:transcriptional regulator with XRE-family HTH domain